MAAHYVKKKMFSSPCGLATLILFYYSKFGASFSSVEKSDKQWLLIIVSKISA
jgi:hypothetical protein